VSLNFLSAIFLVNRFHKRLESVARLLGILRNWVYVHANFYLTDLRRYYLYFNTSLTYDYYILRWNLRIVWEILRLIYKDSPGCSKGEIQDLNFKLKGSRSKWYQAEIVMNRQ